MSVLESAPKIQYQLGSDLNYDYCFIYLFIYLLIF